MRKINRNVLELNNKFADSKGDINAASVDSVRWTDNTVITREGRIVGK